MAKRKNDAHDRIRQGNLARPPSATGDVQMAVRVRNSKQVFPQVSCSIEESDDERARLTKIVDVFKSFIKLTAADTALQSAKKGDFDPLLEHLRQDGNTPVELKNFIASSLDALLQRKPVRKSKPVTAKKGVRDLNIACFVLQLEQWGVRPGRAQEEASRKFGLNMRSVQDIATKTRDEARGSLEISKLLFGSICGMSNSTPEKPQAWELNMWGLTEDDVAALSVAPQSKRRSR